MVKSIQNELFQTHLQEVSYNSGDLPPYFIGLNPEQLKAASHVDGPILILAGAGSGKTRVLTHRIAHLVKAHSVSPKHILAVTFTNKASREMKERLASLLGSQASSLWASTFHSSALRILRRHAQKLGYSSDFVVYDTQDSKGVLKGILKEQNIDDSKYPVSLFQKAIDNAKNNYISSEKYLEHHSGYVENIIADVYDRYQRALLASHAMDFGDLLVNVVRLFREHEDILRSYQAHLKYLLVDEFQDTNKVQYILIRLLAAPQNNLFVVGDDDQSIYAFRGATIHNILNFEKDFPGTKVVKLEQNYRSTARILDSANSVIAKNKERKAKKLWTESDQGKEIVTYAGYDESDEASYIAREIEKLRQTGHKLNEIAIFYRTNAQSRALEDALVQRSIPYRIYGGLKFYDRKEIKDILAYLRLLVNEADNQSFLRVINTPPRGIGPRSVQAIRAAASEGESLMQACRNVASGTKKLGVFIELMDELFAASKTLPLYKLVELTIERTGYGPKLKEMKDVTAESRLENLQELTSIAVTMSHQGETPEEDLRLFLDRVSLTSSEELPVEEAHDQQDSPQEEETIPETVSLMTLHLAKGLEFPVVFFTGLEEGLLPHQKSSDTSFGVSEERRLCYVGMTRAMKQLYITRAKHRGMFSAGGGFGFGSGMREPSRFVFDIPPSCLSEGVDEFLSTTPSHPEVSFDDDTWDEPSFSSTFSRRGFSKKKTLTPFFGKQKKKGTASSFVQTADTLEGDSCNFRSLARANFSDLEIGTKVAHRTFGSGVIEKIDNHPSGKEEKAKVTVRFENFDVPKKLLFRHAKLALVD
ncbi:MAG: UvrD-helicase domain-containing protein [Bdellovibrionales bacterium]|nr:UvrD-helicase domain-containing protein [Bdellovibrionales bacterium]